MWSVVMWSAVCGLWFVVCGCGMPKEVRQCFPSHGAELALGIPHGRQRFPSHGAELALGIPHGRQCFPSHGAELTLGIPHGHRSAYHMITARYATWSRA